MPLCHPPRSSHEGGSVSDRAQVIVLCEDMQAQVFIRRALQRRGVEARKIGPAIGTDFAHQTLQVRVKPVASGG